ncbi:hypothetical protein F0562_015443 [Nyssa sinensis]|uniref:Uncharacterized protein n=1 Tax=Nyssa sinensis TaxID=561372 RepID=A0A5J4ZIS0_9ASTE|nr:hypothetical protein F0562_015443 [Nyssa sinensis]
MLRTLGLSDDITKPSITTDMNLVEELDTTLEVDQELDGSSSTEDAQNRGENVDVQEEFVQEGGVEPTIFGTKASPSQASHSRVHDPDPFAPFVDEAHEVLTSSTINGKAPDLQDPST